MPKKSALTATQIADSYLPTRIDPEAEPSDYLVAQILQLDKDGLVQTAIAERLGTSQSKVSRTLAKYLDTRELARRRLNSAAIALVERVVREADAEQSLEVLDRLDVAPKKRSESGMNGVFIHIGMPNQPAASDPLLSPSLTQDLHRLTADSTASDS